MFITQYGIGPITSTAGVPALRSGATSASPAEISPQWQTARRTILLPDPSGACARTMWVTSSSGGSAVTSWYGARTRSASENG